mmetsp:Transcript_33644/g.54001  ORF Transcript_33644/g.54001 Transcript_33644/m.54001 type:complete len:90 (-) Transcript_33644:159-428(-)
MKNYSKEYDETDVKFYAKVKRMVHHVETSGQISSLRALDEHFRTWVWAGPGTKTLIKWLEKYTPSVFPEVPRKWRPQEVEVVLTEAEPP